MERKRHSPEQIIAKLSGADTLFAGGAGIGQACQRLEVAEAMSYRWRHQYGGKKPLSQTDAAEVREAERHRLHAHFVPLSERLYRLIVQQINLIFRVEVTSQKTPWHQQFCSK